MKDSPVKYIFKEGSFFYISDSGSEHRITKGAIIANGLQDLCIVKEGREVFVKKISETDPKDIHYLPKGDILWLNFDPPLKGMISIIQDMGDDPENMRPFVKALLKYGGDSIKGTTYDMYAGDHY